jgi:hypothetical protein
MIGELSSISGQSEGIYSVLLAIHRNSISRGDGEFDVKSARRISGLSKEPGSPG